MKRVFFVLLLAVSMQGIVSCDKVEMAEQPDYYVDPTTIVSTSPHGWLVFNDPAHIRDIIVSLNESDSAYEYNNDYWRGAIDTNLSQSQIDSVFSHYNYQPDYVYTSFETSRTGFVSLRHQYDYLEDVFLATAGAQDVNSMPDHPMNFRGLNSVVNSKGEYQVGDFVVFNKANGISFFVHQDSIDGQNIQDYRNISLTDFQNATLTNTIVDPDMSSMMTGGDATDTAYCYSIVYGGLATLFIYTATTVANYFDLDDTSLDCRTKDIQEKVHWIVQNQEYCYLKTAFEPYTGIGHFSTAKIEHYEFVNNKFKRTRADIGLKTFCPMIDVDDDCQDGFINYRNIPKTCSSSDLTCYKNDFAKKESHTSFTWWFCNKVKIKNNTRKTYFYHNGSIIFTLVNAW